MAIGKRLPETTSQPTPLGIFQATVARIISNDHPFNSSELDGLASDALRATPPSRRGWGRQTRARAQTAGRISDLWHSLIPFDRTSAEEARRWYNRLAGRKDDYQDK